jgi:ribosomal protein L32
VINRPRWHSPNGHRLGCSRRGMRRAGHGERKNPSAESCRQFGNSRPDLFHRVPSQPQARGRKAGGLRLVERQKVIGQLC